MKLEDIKSGNFYLIKSKCTIWPNGGLIYQVSARVDERINSRPNDLEYPFEITAARFGVKVEEIFPLPINK